MRSATARAFIYTFIITLCVVLTAMALLVADQHTGQAIFGSDYTPAPPTLQAGGAFSLLPPRLQVLLSLPAALRDWILELLKAAP